MTDTLSMADATTVTTTTTWELDPPVPAVDMTRGDQVLITDTVRIARPDDTKWYYLGCRVTTRGRRGSVTDRRYLDDKTIGLIQGRCLSQDPTRPDPNPVVTIYPKCPECEVPWALRHGWKFAEGGITELWAWTCDCKHKKVDPVLVNPGDDA